LDQGEETLQPYCQGERCFCGKARRAQGRGNDLLRQPAADPPPAHERHLVQRIGLTHAVPVDGRGRRTPQTMLLLDERKKYLIEAAQFYPGCTDREIARRLHAALSTYRAGRFRRDRNDTCPIQYRGTLREQLYFLLRVRDHVPSEPAIRRALGYS
jgi:hypothetical protein